MIMVKVERALKLWKTGENEKDGLDDETEATTTRKRVRKTEFDEGWGEITKGYLRSALLVRESKWSKIFRLVSDAGAKNDATDATGLASEELVDDLMDARAHIVLSEGSDGEA